MVTRRQQHQDVSAMIGPEQNMHTRRVYDIFHSASGCGHVSINSSASAFPWQWSHKYAVYKSSSTCGSGHTRAYSITVIDPQQWLHGVTTLFISSDSGRVRAFIKPTSTPANACKIAGFFIVITQDRGHTIVLDGLTQGYSRYRADILQSFTGQYASCFEPECIG